MIVIKPPRICSAHYRLISKAMTTVTSTWSETLKAPTPEEWFDAACEQWQVLLTDHANCEKKAASTALSLIFTYSEDRSLTEKMSRLAREELRHFEQVQRLMVELNVPFQRLSPSRYAEGMRKAMRRDEPGRLIELLVCGALIEARSCERFVRLAPRLQSPIKEFYEGLSASESRHHQLYLRLANERSRPEQDADWQQALDKFAAIEAELITAPDPQFRFHSGLPV
jgi:tRNA 2-(methylsulfanyl)-N6-isopentenyladenosine37 hydroxylase